MEEKNFTRGRNKNWQEKYQRYFPPRSQMAHMKT